MNTSTKQQTEATQNPSATIKPETKVDEQSIAAMFSTGNGGRGNNVPIPPGQAKHIKDVLNAYPELKVTKTAAFVYFHDVENIPVGHLAKHWNCKYQQPRNSLANSKFRLNQAGSAAKLKPLPLPRPKDFDISPYVKS